MYRQEEIVQKLKEEKITLNQLEKFLIVSKKNIIKIYFFLGFVILFAIVMSFLFSMYIVYWFVLSSFFFYISYRLNRKDVISLTKKVKGKKSTIKRLTEELELEKSYPKTTMIRLLAPYHSFKADLVDGKAIIKEKQGKKMVIIGEKTVDECIADFKKAIGVFDILRGQICLRIDYSKDDFKWFEIENLKERL